MKVALLLITLGFGYKVLVEANRQSGFTKTLGQVIATVMIILGLIGTSFAMSCFWVMGPCHGKGFHPWGSMSGTNPPCPISSPVKK